jgi:fibronectin-binding autotransporter adhesin
MNARRTVASTILLLAAVCVPCFTQSAAAQTFTWDSSGNGTQFDGGGSWNLTGSNWWSGSSPDVLWPNSTSGAAVFGAGNGAAGTVTVGSVTVGAVTFNAPGSGAYLLSGGMITLGGAATITTNANSATIGSVLAGSSGLTTAGAGMLNLTGANTYTGLTTVSSGTLQMGTASAFTTTPGTYSIASGAVLSLNAGAGTDYQMPTGTTVVSGGGTFAITSGSLNDNNARGGHNIAFLMSGGLINVPSGATMINGGYSAVLWTSGGTTNKASMNVSGAFDLWDGNTVQVDALTGSGTITHTSYGSTTNLAIGDNNGSGTFSGTIKDTPSAALYTSLTKSGSGIETLSGASTSFGGGTTVSGGSLVLANLPNYYIGFDNNGGLYAPGRGLTLQNNAALVVNANTSQMQFANTTLSGLGTLVKTGGSNLLLGYNGYTTNISFAAGSLIDVEGGLLRNEYGNGNWTNNKASMYIAAGASVDTWDSPGGITIDALNGAGTIQHTSFGGNPEPLTIGVAGGSGTFSGTITNTSGFGLELIKSGSGMEVLNGTLSYTSSTLVNGGTLQVQSAVPSGYGTAISSGAMLQYNISGSVTQNATTLSGAGILQKVGAGSVTFAAGGQAVNWNLGSGALIEVEAGTLVGGSNIEDFWTNNLAALNVAAGGLFNGVEANVRVDYLSGSGTIQSGFSGAGYSAFTFGVNNGSGTFSGVLANSMAAANFVKAGTGLQVLAGPSTYTGATTISGGTLQLGTGQSGQDCSINGTSGVTDNAALVYNLFGPQTTISAYSITGSGSLTQLGPGALTLANSNGYTGGTTITAGTMAVGASGTIGSGNLTIRPGAVFDVSAYGGSGYTFSGGALSAGRTGSFATDVNGTLNVSNAAINVAGGKPGTISPSPAVLALRAARSTTSRETRSPRPPVG